MNLMFWHFRREKSLRMLISQCLDKNLIWLCVQEILCNFLKLGVLVNLGADNMGCLIKA